MAIALRGALEAAGVSEFFFLCVSESYVFLRMSESVDANRTSRGTLSGAVSTASRTAALRRLRPHWDRRDVKGYRYKSPGCPLGDLCDRDAVRPSVCRTRVAAVRLSGG